MSEPLTTGNIVKTAASNSGLLLLRGVKFSITYLCERNILKPNTVIDKIWAGTASDFDKIFELYRNEEGNKFQVSKEILMSLMGKKDKNGSKTFSDLVVSQVRQEIGNILKVNKVEEQAHNLLNSKNSTLNDLIDSVDVLIQILSLKSCTSPNDILVEIIQVLKKFMKNKIVSKILKYHFTKLPSRIKPYKRLCRKIQQRNTKQDKENIVSVLKCIGNGVCITYGSFFEPDSKQWNSFVKALVKVRFHKLRHEKAHQIKKELQTVFNIEKLKETNKPKPPPLQGTSLDPFERFQKELFTRTDRITDNNTQGTSFDWAFTVSPEYFEDVVQQLVLREWSKNGEENEIIFTDNYTYLINEKLPSHTIVVTGEPGSGKSTYVAKIAKDWAKGNPILRHWFSLVFFIRCQEFGNKIDTSDDTSFGEELRRLMMKNNDYDLFPDIMKDNGTLIIFDGFDENPLPEIFNLLKTPRSIKLKEAEYCPEATFIITTRPEYATIGHEYEIKTERPDKDSMKSMSINLLKIPGELIKGIRVEGFSKETAHKYLRVRLGDDTDILEGLDEEMIRNPLYATMLCALGKKKIQEIQIKPYQFRKKLIFDEFDRLHRRHVVESKEAIISTEYQKYIAEAKKLAVAVCLERYADDRIKLPKYDELNGKLLGKLCLIRCNNTQRYTFIHRTFEEYYAAVWLIENLKEQIFLVEKILKDNHKEIIYFLMGFEPELLRSYLQNRRICLLPVTLEVISSLQKHLDKKYKLSIYDWKINGPDFVEMFKAIAKYREIYFYRCIIDCDSMSSGEWGIYNQQGFYFIDCQLNAKAFCTFVSAKKTPWIRLIDTKINASPDLLADQEYPEICNFRIVGKYGLKNVQLVVPLIEKSGFNKIKRQEKWLGLADFSIDADELIDLMKRVAKTHAVFLSLSLKIDNVDAITTSYNHTSINRIKLDIRHSHYEQKNIIAALSLIQKIKLNELIIQDRTEKKESVLERLLVSLLDLGVTKSLNLLKLQLHCNFQQLNISLLNLIHSCTTILNVVIQIKESCEKIASIPDHKPNWIDDAAYEVMKNLLQPNRPNQFELYTDETLWRD